MILTWKDDKVGRAVRVSGTVRAETHVKPSITANHSAHCQLAEIRAVLATHRRRVDTSTCRLTASHHDEPLTVKLDQRCTVLVHSLQPLHGTLQHQCLDIAASWHGTGRRHGAGDQLLPSKFGSSETCQKIFLLSSSSSSVYFRNTKQENVRKYRTEQ